MRTEVNSSQLMSKISNGNIGRTEVHLYMASLQINRNHICSTTMFQPNFFISSATCVCHLYNAFSTSQEISIVLGHHSPHLDQLEF